MRASHPDNKGTHFLHRSQLYILSPGQKRRRAAGEWCGRTSGRQGSEKAWAAGPDGAGSHVGDGAEFPAPGFSLALSGVNQQMEALSLCLSHKLDKR